MAEVLVVGHICLDLIPGLTGQVSFEPGKLVEAGPVTLSLGGAVANTGIALSRLGLKTKLVAKTGDDLFGRSIVELLREQAPDALNGLMVSRDDATSYTVVVSLSTHDRMFLHHPGANAAFGSADVSDEDLRNYDLVHLGYPPLLARMYRDGGEELAHFFRRAKQAGATTSLDLSLPDAGSESGHADWIAILGRVLPYVDFFLPSVEEVLFMLEPKMFTSLQGAVYGRLPEKVVEKVTAHAIDLGAKNVGVKVGSRGFFLRLGHGTSDLGRAAPAWRAWSGADIWHPCFKVDVKGTTGAGDATISGFLMGVLRGFSPIEAARAAVAVGAFCCERADSLSGIKSWPEVQTRIDAGWEILPVELDRAWERREQAFVRVAPR